MEKTFEIKLVSTKKQKVIEDRGCTLTFGKTIDHLVHGVFQDFTEDNIEVEKPFRFYKECSYPTDSIRAASLIFRDTDKIWEVNIEFQWSAHDILVNFETKIEALRVYNYVIEHRKSYSKT